MPNGRRAVTASRRGICEGWGTVSFVVCTLGPMVTDLPSVTGLRSSHLHVSSLADVDVGLWPPTLRLIGDSPERRH